MRKGLPDPWPLAKVTINMDSPSQWVSKMGRLFFADEYVRHAVGTYTTKQLPQLQTALKAVQDVLTDLETRVIEFLSEWLVALLMPAKHVLETRSPHLSFMLLKEYWFRELYLGLKVAASFDRNESFIKTIDGQIRCITAGFIFFCPSPLPFGGSTVLSLTRGPAGNRTTTGSLSATECPHTNFTTRTTTSLLSSNQKGPTSPGMLTISMFLSQRGWSPRCTIAFAANT